ncbi:DEKNAAC105308 [Brettanomyces naardenensis]|uniref:DEKNAAC105308 n=1 Tax=Brettanomyces naardenensis TaxID=13370 RepID=A0A448YTD3_BRENA|nr:DEKNAAC105308 [Brettanomyces naardenensis]
MPSLIPFILIISILLRFIIPTLLPNLSQLLDQSPIFSTPINSYRTLKEAVFLATNSLNPYKQGEIIHHPPILLEVFKHLQSPTLINLFFALVDTLFGLQLIKLNQQLSKKDSKHTYFPSYIIAAFYTFNPLALLATFAKSTYLINNLVIITLLNSLLSNPFSLFPYFLLALSTSLTYYSWYFIVPLLAYSSRQATNHHLPSSPIIVKGIIAFLSSLSLLTFINYKLSASSFNFIQLVYGTIVSFKKITPNLGLWWYFFTEIFEFFSAFYTAIFNLYSFIFIVPMTMRFIGPSTSTTADALFAIWCEIGFVNFSRAYPTITDLNLYFSLSMLFKPLYRKLKFPTAVSNLAMFTALLLLPVFYYVWMGFNSGNANFFYAMGLVHNLIQVLMLTDFIWSKLQIEYYDTHEIDIDKVNLKLTQI